MVVSFAAVNLKEVQEVNKAVDKQKNILQVAGIYYDGIDVEKSLLPTEFLNEEDILVLLQDAWEHLAKLLLHSKCDHIVNVDQHSPSSDHMSKRHILLPY